jgi:hypothetical protein
MPTVKTEIEGRQRSDEDVASTRATADKSTIRRAIQYYPHSIVSPT